MSNELQQSADEVQTAIVRFDKVQAGIAALREQYEKVIFPVDTPAGMKDARAARAKIREPRYSVEQIRTGAKAPILKLGRLLDARAKEITEALLALETPIDESIKFEEGRKEREEQARIEAARVEEERRVAAARAEEEKRQAAERAEIELLRAEIARRDADERARLDAEAAKERAAREAEEAKARAVRAAEEEKARAAREADEAAQRAALEAEQKRQAAERAAIDAENKRLATERAKLQAEQDAARRKAEDAERQRQAEIAAERRRKEAAEAAAKKAKYPGEQAIAAALCDHFGVAPEVAAAWLRELKAGKK